MREKLPELTELLRTIEALEHAGHSHASGLRVKELTSIKVENTALPILAITLGSQDPDAPAFGIIGGVHGLERIGTKVVLSYLRTLSRLLKWDGTLQRQLEHSRLVFVPLVNPGGMWLGTRSNVNGVDLMRNAPVEATGRTGISIAAGHHISPRLPWYRGKKGAALEPEAAALCKLMREEVLNSPVALTLDVHSGYGVVDRLWFPYARTREPFANLPEAYALKELLDDVYPNHVYRVEPQSQQYLTHGDLWDYLYDEHRAQNPQKLFMPLSLEMGSWAWLKKNPTQFFSLLGAFNPIPPHRRARTLRRHLTLFDFLHRAVLFHRAWARLEAPDRLAKNSEATKHWYGKAA